MAIKVPGEEREEEIWVLRITPEAGTQKSGEAREVPLHPHLVEMGLPEFVASRGSGPLFYAPDRRKSGNDENPLFKKTGDKLARWTRMIGVDDPNVDPNHGWRHRFKEMAREVRMREAVCDAIQGHAPRTVGEKYGSHRLGVKWIEINLLPRYEVSAPTGPRPITPATQERSRKRMETAKKAKAKADAQKCDTA